MEETNTNWTHLTALLQRSATGDRAAQSSAYEQVYSELHQMAQRVFSSERNGHTLQPTSLVNEAFLRLSTGATVRFEDRAHFFALAARLMRRILVDHARAKKAEKRGGDWTMTLTSDLPGVAPGMDILNLNAVLDQLEELDERTARVVDLRFFAGFTEAETAKALDVSPATVRSDWQFAKGWLGRRLRPESD